MQESEPTVTEIDPPSQTSRRHPWLRALYRVPLLVLATIYFLIDDVVLAAVRPVIAWAAELRPFARLGAALQRLSPYATLILFLVPFVVLEPFKLWALWLLALGHLVSGGIMLVTSHLTSIVLVERLFHATRDKLLTIAWFARVYGWVSLLYDLSVGRLRATPAWQAVIAALRTIRRAIGDLARTLRPGLETVGRALRPVMRAARERLADLVRRLRNAAQR